jgi:flagellar basal body-associated protein FliL
MIKKDIDDTSDLFELDKLELPESDTPAVGATGKVGAADPGPAPEPETRLEAGGPPGKNRTIALSVVSVAIAAVLLAALLVTLTPAPPEPNASPAESSRPKKKVYLPIGPIITNLDQTRRIEVALKIGFYAGDEQPDKLKIRIVDRILVLLTSPDTRKQLVDATERDQKRYVERAITDLVKNERIDDIAFKQIEVY